LPHGDGGSFAQTAMRHRVAVLPGGGLDPSGRSEDHVRIHFLAPVDALTEAVRRLAEAWRAYSPPTTRIAGPAAMAV
jgi:aspartate/methionine/tyrosine aminotransferase